MSSGMQSPNTAMQAHKATPFSGSRTVAGGMQENERLASHDDHLGDEDGDDVFSNPDTAELESRSDATGATSPAPNSPGPGSPSHRIASQHISVVAPSGLDQFATLKPTDITSAATSSHGSPTTMATQTGGKNMALSSLPQANVHLLQRQFEDQVRLNTTPRSSGNETLAAQDTSASTLVTPTKNVSRPAYGRALSASGATMQTMSSSMHPTSSISGSSSRFGPPTPRLGGHASSLSASNFTLPHNHLPSAHGLPSDPREVETVSKLFAHPPAQSPAEELQSFAFSNDGYNRRSSTAMVPSQSGGVASISSPSTSVLAARRLSRPTTRPSSPDRYVSPSRRSAKRASLGGAMGLGLSPRIGGANATDDAPTTANALKDEASIFERDIEHRDASHVLSKQEAMDVAIPSVLDDAIEAIQSEDADQLEIVAPHAAPPPLALSMQALSAHSNSQIRVDQSSNPGSAVVGPSSGLLSQRSAASSPRLSPSPPLSNAGAGSEPPVGSMAAQIAERLGGTRPSVTAVTEGVEGATTNVSRHRRPNSDVSNISNSSSMRSRSPQDSLAVGVQQVLAANSTSPRSPTGTQSIITSRTDAQTLSANSTAAASPSSISTRGALPTATALPALPLPNPFRSHSPNTPLAPLPDVNSLMLPSVSMDGAVMPSNESATLDASLGNLADVIASQPATSTNSLANSPSLRMRGLGLEDQSYEASPYSSRSPVPGALTSSQPVSPIVGRSAGHSKSPTTAAKSKLVERPVDDYAAPSTLSTKKRLSFFSYADIINQTPAEVINFDEAVRQAESATTIKHPSSVSIIPASPTPTQSTSTMK